MATNTNPSPDDRFINQVCSNTKSDFIEITEDKLENILIKFIRDLKNSTGWLTPLTVFLTVLVAILTSDFNNFLNIPKYVWCAIFYIILAVSFILSVYKGVLAIRNRKKIRLETLMNRIKNN